MARRSKWTEEKVAQWQAQGYGKGVGEAYKPWIEVHDFSSLGVSRRVHSFKTNRVHHLLSNVEYSIFVAAEWSRSVIDIREQYPLDRELTQTIAHEAGILHPCFPGTHIPAVLTADFLLTLADRGSEKYVAFNAKTDEEAEDARSIEKLEIQRRSFEALGIEHHLIYRSRIPQQAIKNIEWIRDALLKPEEIEPSPGYFTDLCSRMGSELRTMPLSSEPLTRYCSTFDQRYGLQTGTGLRVARMLMKERALMADLNSTHLSDMPVCSFLMTSREGQLRTIGGL